MVKRVMILQLKTRAVGVRVSSEQCGIEGIVLGIEVALQCFAEKHDEGHGGLFTSSVIVKRQLMF